MNEYNPAADVQAAVDALTAGQITEDAFVSRLVALPRVPQLPVTMPDPPDISDGRVTADGPVRALVRATLNEAITAELYARTVKAMLAEGHEA
ncbi:hypothetical protein [Leifsonia sp. fls2-241-R2A-40a]|uniref:hypothetical protein n=1 Tax=Leifsonia sp. fls2-241-R2A-40a TaxID=3040290 RepID=UPI00254FF9CF|nr:hypothetical protein [Leifsonia sp. fls2-241-R2A-40a]